MNEIARFKGPSGDETVVLSAVDDQNLLDAAENGADVAAYDLAKARLASGEDEFVPSEVLDRMMVGDNRIRVWREYRGLTSVALAAQAGITQGLLSQIENGERDGTADALERIAKALRVWLDDIALTAPAQKGSSGSPGPDNRFSQVLQPGVEMTTALLAKELGVTKRHVDQTLKSWLKDGLISVVPGSHPRVWRGK